MAWEKGYVRYYATNYPDTPLGKLQAEIFPKYMEIHEDICQAYYDGTPYGEYKKLDQETFNKLHSLIHDKKFIALHEAIQERNKEGKEVIAESEYRYQEAEVEDMADPETKTVVVTDKVADTQARIDTNSKEAVVIDDEVTKK
jgi:hypothetical protein